MWASISVPIGSSLRAWASDLTPLVSPGSASSSRNLCPFLTSWRPARRESSLTIFRFFMVEAV